MENCWIQSRLTRFVTSGQNICMFRWSSPAFCSRFLRETMTGITACSTDLQRNDSIGNTVTIKKKLLATLPNSHLIDLWPVRQQGRLPRRMWLMLCLCVPMCVLALQVGGVCVCSCSVEGTDSDPKQHKLCKLQVSSADSMCVCVYVFPAIYREAVERSQLRDTSQKPPSLFPLWPFLRFLNSLGCFTFPAPSIFLKRSCSDF